MGSAKTVIIFFEFLSLTPENNSWKGVKSARPTRNVADENLRSSFTKEGNSDFGGYNPPVCFIRGTVKVPDFIHLQKRHPSSNLNEPVR